MESLFLKRLALFSIFIMLPATAFSKSIFVLEPLVAFSQASGDTKLDGINSDIEYAAPAMGLRVGFTKKNALFAVYAEMNGGEYDLTIAPDGSDDIELTVQSGQTALILAITPGRFSFELSGILFSRMTITDEDHKDDYFEGSGFGANIGFRFHKYIRLTTGMKMLTYTKYEDADDTVGSPLVNEMDDINVTEYFVMLSFPIEFDTDL